jgi:TP901 family phage tail tape measure protein
MSVKSLEARLVISADDRTDAAFGSVASKLRNLQRVMESARPQMAAIRSAQAAMPQMAAIRSAQAIRAQMDAVASAKAANAGSGVDVLASRAVPFIAAGAAARGAAQAVVKFGEVERAMTRIGLTADATAEQTKAATEDVFRLAVSTAMPFNEARKGLEALVAQGRSLPEAMAFLPSVVKTAQAAGAEAEDIAKSAGAISTHLGISASDMQSAFDTLVKGGNLGQFELKDMARYLPSLVPQAKAIGMTGQDGLKRLVSMLQVVREGSGTAEEAATRVRNIFQKMESEETVKNFKEMGVDLPAALAKARSSGQDLLRVFIELTNTAIKGDMSKIPRLFKDMEVMQGMLALTPAAAKLRDLQAALRQVDGASLQQLKRVLEDSKASTDAFAASWERLVSKLGEAVSPAAVPAMDYASNVLQKAIDAPDRHRKLAEKLRQDETARLAPDGPAYQARVAYLNKTIAAIDNRKYKPPGTVEKRSEFASELAILKAINDTYKETAGALEKSRGQSETLKRLAVLQAERSPLASMAPGYGRLGFGLRGPVGLTPANGMYVPPYDLPGTPANVPLPPTGRPDSSAILQKLDDVLGPGKIEAKVSGAADISVSVTASPLLVATVTQQVKAALVGWSLNSVGSTGRSAPDLDRRD